MSDFNATKYKNDFTKENYDRLNVQIPKGQKERLKAYLTAQGYTSLNDYINKLISCDLAAHGEPPLSVDYIVTLPNGTETIIEIQK